MARSPRAKRPDTSPETTPLPEDGSPMPDTATAADDDEGVRVQTVQEGVASGAVAPDHTDPHGTPHEHMGTPLTDREANGATFDDVEDYAFDPSRVGGPIPESGVWLKLPTFHDEMQFPDLGITNDGNARSVFKLYADRWVHVPAAHVQTVRTAVARSFPWEHRLELVEAHEDPTRD